MIRVAIRNEHDPIIGAPAQSDRAAQLVVLVATIVGLLGFLWPFLLPITVPSGDADGGRAAPFLLAIVTGLCLLAMLAELGNGAVRPARVVALLGVLVAVNASLRLVPAFLGASPIFMLIVLVGAVFGSAIGFQMGALTILVSSLLTGGIGPWLPYQVLGAGWVGMSAALIPRDSRPRSRLLLLAGFGAIWGLLYGALLNLSFWPFTAPGASVHPGLAWTPDLSLPATVSTYARFYLITSLPYDLTRSVANAVLILALGGPVLRLLERYRTRFTWQPLTLDDAPEPGAAAEEPRVG